MKALRICLLIVGIAFVPLAFADNDAPSSHDGPPPGETIGPGGSEHMKHHHMGPPPEFLAACKGQSVEAKVTVKAPDGRNMEGHCRLMFVPDNRPGREGPPDEGPSRQGGGLPPAGGQHQGW